MSDSGDNPKYKWTPESTSLLVSIWSDKQVQKQLEDTAKPQLIWESVARYMKKKGYNATSKQCRSRMKQVLVCYREAKRAGTHAGVEQYYDSIDRVLKNKRFERIDRLFSGVDTVDATINIKSPPKEVKTNKNLQMRHKYQEPVQSLLRTEALSPSWRMNREYEYPDSPESNETIVAGPPTVFYSTRNAAISTGDQVNGRSTVYYTVPMEEPVREEYHPTVMSSYPYGEVPYQNTVQNVQNQIIQENMQQNRVWNQAPQQNLQRPNYGFQRVVQNMNQGANVQVMNDPMHTNMMPIRNMNPENIIRQQNQLQQNAIINNQAVPQEPRKTVFGQNVAATYKQYRDTVSQTTADTKQSGSLSPNYSPDMTQNLNDAFCQSKNETKLQNLNETYINTVPTNNPTPLSNPELTMLTNNATYNDDSLLLEFLMNSSQLDNCSNSKDTAVNTDELPNVPLRKKKAQKLEQLVLSAISSQNDVVNKILAAQNDMVTKFLDIDRDRQSRLENRLEHLLNIVHASVLNKNQDQESDTSPSSSKEPQITSLAPPPKPGAVPPKLDLVPPKPCRVPCTMPNSNVELINQNSVSTRPGVISPIISPSKKPGTIWSKLGPVSQSPFVKAQQRLGLQPISGTNARTQSSAERRIATEVGHMKMDTQTMIYETSKFLEVERYVDAKVENARREQNISQTLSARRELFTQREPTAEMILISDFIKAERRASLPDMYRRDILKANGNGLKNGSKDDLITGRGEGYEYLRRLNTRSDHELYKPCDTSTPAKIVTNEKDTVQASNVVPKQTIQELARLVMNSARWKDVRNQQYHLNQLAEQEERNQNPPHNDGNITFVHPKDNLASEANAEVPERLSKANAYDRNRFSYNGITNEQNGVQRPLSYNDAISQKPCLPMGFTTENLSSNVQRGILAEPTTFGKSIGFVDNNMPNHKQETVRFMDEALSELQRMYIEQINNEERKKTADFPYMTSNGNVITVQHRNVADILPRKIKHFNEKETDSDNDEEFLDTTGTMPPPSYDRKQSISSVDTINSNKIVKPESANCVIS